MRTKYRQHRTMALLSFLVSLVVTACETSPAPETQTLGLLPLPEFAECESTNRPLLPAKWQAAALMQDFVMNSLMFGQFVYDESVQAFRFSLADRYGTELDFLVTHDRKLYLLKGGETPSSCSLLTTDSPYTVPTRDWLNDGAVCVGQAPILRREQAWWKDKSDEGANWFWFNTGNGLPFRSMYYEDVKITDPVPIYEHFTFNYFPTFEEVSATNLDQILQLCLRSGDTPTPLESFDIHSIDSLMAATSYPVPSAEPLAQVQKWIPELSECSSPSSLPPPWPDQVQASVFMTAVSFPPNPFPTRVFYDWSQQAQNSSLYYNPPTATNYVQVALLTGNTGYIRIEDAHGSISMCQQVLPGPQVPNWNELDGCECRAQIDPGSTLNPSSVPTKILWCPTDLSANQVFWTWYSDRGTPIVFMQSNSSPSAGTGLNLADYYHWSPGSVAPSGTFDIPSECLGKQKHEVPVACHDCHLPTTSAR